MIFDAKPNYDPLNKKFPAVTEETRRKLTSRMYDCPLWLDQNGTYGCSAFATLHNIAAIEPSNVWRYMRPFTIADAGWMYNSAQKIDQWAGKEPAIKGTSVVACMKVAKKAKLIASYSHAFGLAQLKQTISHIGPAVLTMPWHQKMTQPLESGYIKVGGPVVGWHAMLVRGIDVLDRMFVLRQNAGRDYGDNGDVWITFKGMGILLREGATACLARLSVK